MHRVVEVRESMPETLRTSAVRPCTTLHFRSCSRSSYQAGTAHPPPLPPRQPKCKPRPRVYTLIKGARELTLSQ